MKQNFFMLLAAVLLSGASAFAQSGNNESLMGDVNGDGRVDIVDVTTVIDIYLNTVPDTPQTTTYYWYAGQDRPSTISGTPTVDDTNFTNNKWHTLSNNQIQKFVTGGDVTKNWYVAVPSILNLSPKASDMSTLDRTWTQESGNISVNGINYVIWKVPADDMAMVYMK